MVNKMAEAVKTRGRNQKSKSGTKCAGENTRVARNVPLFLFVVRVHIQLENEIPSHFSLCSCLDVWILFFVFDDVAFEEECRPIVRDILHWERKIVLSFFVV